MRKLTYLLAGALVGLGCLSPLHAQVVRPRVIVADPDGDQPRKIHVQVKLDEDVAIGKYWIGLMTEPVSDLVKSQMRLKTGLAVGQVVPEGPAAEAGIKVHDILVSFNGTKLVNISSLLSSVTKSEGKKSKIVLMRGGSEKTIEIQPAERPKKFAMRFGGEHELDIDLPEDVEKLLKQNGRKMFFFGPGMHIQPGQPIKVEQLLKGFNEEKGGNAKKESLSLSITRDNDGPAKITVERNGKKHTVTEETLDKLPADIREHVKKHLSGEHKPHAHDLKEFRWIRPEVKLRLHEHDETIEKQLKEVREELNKIFKELDSLRGERKRSKNKKDDVEA